MLHPPNLGGLPGRRDNMMTLSTKLHCPAFIEIKKVYTFQTVIYFVSIGVRQKMIFMCQIPMSALDSKEIEAGVHSSRYTDLDEVITTLALCVYELAEVTFICTKCFVNLVTSTFY